MSTSDDFYRVLEIQKDASQNDIKKAYRKLAVRWHPDKNPDNVEGSSATFKRISEAYAVLVDPEQRRQYDSDREPVRGFGGFRNNSDRNQHQGSGRFHHFNQRDPFEMFEEFFRRDDHFGDMMSEHFGGFGRSPFGRMGSMFDDPFFSDFGDSDQLDGRRDAGKRGRASSGSPRAFDVIPRRGGDGALSQFRFGGGGMTGKSVSTSTVVRNGKRRTVRTTTIMRGDGTEETSVEEFND